MKNTESGDGQGRPERPCTYDLQVLHMYIQVYSVCGRDKFKHQKGRGIIIFKRGWKEFRLLDQQLHLSHVIEVPFPFIRTTQDGMASQCGQISVY